MLQWSCNIVFGPFDSLAVGKPKSHNSDLSTFTVQVGTKYSFTFTVCILSIDSNVHKVSKADDQFKLASLCLHCWAIITTNVRRVYCLNFVHLTALVAK